SRRLQLSGTTVLRPGSPPLSSRPAPHHTHWRCRFGHSFYRCGHHEGPLILAAILIYLRTRPSNTTHPASLTTPHPPSPKNDPSATAPHHGPAPSPRPSLPLMARHKKSNPSATAHSPSPQTHDTF